MEPKPRASGRLLIGLLVLVLWLITITVAIIEILLVQSIVVGLYARFGGDDFATGLLIRNVTAVVMGVVCMVLVIATGEYHLRHVGQSSSWKLFAWTVGAQLAIFLLYLIV